MEKRNFYLFALMGMAMLLSVLASCKKEYLKTPFNQIETFSVTDSLGNQLKGSITGDSIIVYWPPFQTAPTKVTPQIAVSSGATISPASGAQVTFASGTIYTVTAQDGSKKTYKLIPLINQPAPVFDVQATDVLQIGDYLKLRGQYFITDTNQTKLYLTNSANKDFQLSLKNASFNPFYLSVQLPQNNTIDTGYYKVKLISGNNTIVKGPFHFGVPAMPLLTSPDLGKNLKAGQVLTFTIPGPFAKYFNNTFVGAQAIFYIGDNFDMATANISVPTAGTLTMTIPADAPAGIIYYIEFHDKDGNFLTDWSPSTADITIVP
ncbi:hypothetical protein AAFN85_25260 [Mucilaginibacter sp. CAU 1740]|uniref:hypothetical protein n=1 Tax=Mucilaginibacter sp. CAU 1740 TaxID=3140365 RepID=UPI00325B8E6E